MMDPIRCQLLADSGSLRSGALENFIARTPLLQLVDSGPSAELLLLETHHPALGGVLLGRSPDSGRLHALDFLTKPYDYGSFLRAIQKIRDQLRRPDSAAPSSEPAYFFVKSDYKIQRIDTERILYIEGMKNYAKIYLYGESRPIISLISLKALQQKLPDDTFLRVHRSYIVHLRYIQTIERSTIAIGAARIPIADKHKAQTLERIHSR